MDLKLFNQAVNNRFNTVIKTIEDKNNTFFDAYLNLLESTIKFILDDNNINYDSTKTCGLIFRAEEVKTFFLNDVRIDELMYNKVLDYIKKSNDSKHKEEKQIDINAVLVRMEFYYSFINKYYAYRKIEFIIFNPSFYFECYGKTEKINNEYKEELNRKVAELNQAYLNRNIAEEEYNKCINLLKDVELEKFAIDEQNNILKNQLFILSEVTNNIKINDKLDDISEKLDNVLLNKTNQKNATNNFVNKQKEQREVLDFLFGAKKEYVRIDLDSKTLGFRKITLWISGLITLVLGLFTSIFVTRIDIYTTFTLFENIFMFQILLILLYSLSYENKMLDTVLCKKSTNKFKFDYEINFESYKGREKKRYKIIRILTYISSVLNIMYIIPFGNCIHAVIFEILFMISVFIFNFFKNELNEGYELLVLFTNLNKENKVVTIGYDYLAKRYIGGKELDSYCKAYNIDK